jgi:hypothetical protein
MQLESIAMRKMVGMSPTEQGWHVTPSSFVPIERDEGKTRAPIAESDARVTLTMEAARAAFEEIDKNHDEELSQIEYIKALRRNPELAKRLGDVFSIECVLYSMCLGFSSTKPCGGTQSQPNT